MASLLVEIPSHALADVTGGRIRSASGGKHGAANEKIMQMMAELRSTLEGLKASRGNNMAMFLPLMIAMRGGNPEQMQALAKAMAPGEPPKEAPKAA